MYFNLRPNYMTQWLYTELISSRNTLKEYEIIGKWKQLGWLPSNCLGSSLQLFRTHFFIFHQLFHFHKRLLAQRAGRLNIHTLEIKYEEADQNVSNKEIKEGFRIQELCKLDSLLHYYLDWRPLFETKSDEIQRLMEFAAAGISKPHRLQEALHRFELTPPLSAQKIKHQYRKLAKRHHPDKGGSLSEIQMINEDKVLLMHWLNHQHI